MLTVGADQLLARQVQAPIRRQWYQEYRTSIRAGKVPVSAHPSRQTYPLIHRTLPPTTTFGSPNATRREASR